MKQVAAFLTLAFCCTASFAQDSANRAQTHFDYDPKAPLNVKETSTTKRGAVSIIDFSYDSPRGGRVPAYLVVPDGPGPFAAIVFGHWANTEKSPKTSNRSEFLEEAIALAQAGTVSLLIDAPFARPGFKSDPDPLSSQDTEVMEQQIVDLRRGVDLLLARKDVDPARLAYVGHSFDAAVGGILRGIEPRFKTLVLMAGVASERALVLSDEPRMLRFRKRVGDDKVRAYMDKYDWADPVHYVGLSGKAPVLVQHATHDEFGSEANFRRQVEFVAEPKTVKWYDAKHALNAQARKDRYTWLRDQLGLKPLPAGILEEVPEVQ